MTSIQSVLPIPEELTLEMMSYLDVKDLGRCCRVSKEWQRVASDDILWRELGKRALGWIAVPKTGIKKYLDSHCITSLQGFAERVKLFADNIPENTLGILRCVFSPEEGQPRDLKITLIKQDAVSTLSALAFIVKKLPKVCNMLQTAEKHNELQIKLTGLHIPDLEKLADQILKVLGAVRSPHVPREQSNYAVVAAFLVTAIVTLAIYQAFKSIG